ncbi:hypothetical protein HDF16_001464 [Granulicella aggregans]|uniref:Uncharacterized protein n=1 Tax=Granulicella aggregans TaxID=474949 RepID=A0A7W8E323_9BACT|nr:hypothetical protein [Granulicella aggregans]MBB5056779.1 hypothetical protein [Granulicella aggregans]
MAKKTTQRSFNDVLSLLGGQRFDVAPAHDGSRRTPAGFPPGFKVSKYGCAAEIAEAPSGSDGTVLVLARPGWLLGGEISRLVDKGYQKFFTSSKIEIPATADHLRALHTFTEELNEATGSATLYNQSLGTTSDSYLYDRVKGRE